MNIDRLIDLMMEAYNAEYEYRTASAEYKRKHGHSAYLDCGERDDEKKHLEYLYYQDDNSKDSVYYVLAVLDLSDDQKDRLHSVVKAMKRWYKDTNWTRCPDEGLLYRLNNYVICGLGLCGFTM